MKNKEDIVKEFAQNKPSPEDDDIQSKLKLYNRERLLLETLLDVREQASKSLLLYKLEKMKSTKDVNAPLLKKEELQ